MNIPIALHRFLAKRAGAQASRELAGASHAISASEPEAITAAILDATTAPLTTATCGCARPVVKHRSADRR